MSAHSPSRRLVLAGGAAVVGVAAGLLPRAAAAGPAEARALVERLAAGRARPGRLVIDTASIAENGAIVPVTLRAESPMTEADYCRSIHLVSERNPFPLVGRFDFTPLAGRAEVQTRIRLADSQTLVAVAEMSDGSLWIAEKSVEVTVGGCTG